jgi:hypothetical protein
MIYPGHILAKVAEWARQERASKVDCHPGDQVTVSNHQANGAHGIHQARVTLSGDPTTYRLIIAPADAPITVNGHPIGEHFAQPLGDR